MSSDLARRLLAVAAMRILSLLAPLPIALGLFACSQADPEPTGPTAGAAFDLQPISSNDDGSDVCQGACSPGTFLLTQVTDTTVEAIWAVRNQTIPASLTRSGDAWNLKTPVSIRMGTSFHRKCESALIIDTATFDLGHADAEGGLGLLMTGNATFRNCSDDYQNEVPHEVTMQGVPDARGATATWNGTLGFHLENGSIALSKPLEASAKATLVPSAGGDPIPAIPQLENGLVIGFGVDRLLPLGAEYVVQFEGKDFAGLAPPAPLTVSGFEDFGILAQDGFESGSAAGFVGAEVVESFGIPALHGQRMLHVPPGGSGALLRLQRTGSEKNLVMDLRRLNECKYAPGSQEYFKIAYAVIGVDGVIAGNVAHSGTVVELSGQLGYASELQAISLPIASGGTDVIVYMFGDPYSGISCARSGALVDDVRLE